MGKDFYTKKICGIYLITNTKNGMKYCGQSVDITQRWKQHTTPNKSVIGAAIAKDVESFTFKILEQCPREMLNEREKYYIELYVCLHPYGYNQTTGGASGSVVSELTKKKQSIGMKGKNVGKVRTQETKAKMSAALKGITKSEETRERMSTWQIGRCRSEETKEKIRITNTGKTQSAETIAKKVASMTGGKRSEETKEKMRLAWLKRKMDKTNNNEKELK